MALSCVLAIACGVDRICFCSEAVGQNNTIKMKYFRSYKASKKYRTRQTQISLTYANFMTYVWTALPNSLISREGDLWSECMSTFEESIGITTNVADWDISCKTIWKLNIKCKPDKDNRRLLLANQVPVELFPVPEVFTKRSKRIYFRTVCGFSRGENRSGIFNIGFKRTREIMRAWPTLDLFMLWVKSCNLNCPVYQSLNANTRYALKEFISSSNARNKFFNDYQDLEKVMESNRRVLEQLSNEDLASIILTFTDLVKLFYVSRNEIRTNI